MPVMKYYFISYACDKVRADEMTDRHPVEWLVMVREENPKCDYCILFWEEVSQGIYEKFGNLI